MTASVRLLVCTPAYGGNMNFEYVTSLLLLDRAARAAGMDIGFHFLGNESLIQRARNFLCDYFMKQTDYTHLLFVDADIQFRASDIIDMVRCNVDVIGATYPKKMIHWNRLDAANLDAIRAGDASSLHEMVCVNEALEQLPNETKPESEVAAAAPMPVRWIGTGCLLIKREVLTRMQDDSPERWFWANEKQIYAYFDCVLWNNIYLSEDYYFCERWRELGGTVHCARWARCTHWGTYGFH